MADLGVVRRVWPLRVLSNKPGTTFSADWVGPQNVARAGFLFRSGRDILPHNRVEKRIPNTFKGQRASAHSARIQRMRLRGVPYQLEGPAAIERRVADIATQPFVRHVAILPDCHWKPQMEFPSSVAVDCGDHVVPDITSVAINDCMSLVLTNWHKDRVDAKFFGDFFDQVNRRTSPALTARTPYSPSRSELVKILYEGAAAAENITCQQKF